VRSIGAGLGKEVELEVVGGETELDKMLADELSDLLLHMIRNALGHGIETPAERTKAGKPAVGRVTLSAEARGRDVAITVSDDGRGIDPARVLEAARRKGLLKPNEKPPDPFDVVFLPGFSTADEVSELSGRGVGLDVVRSKIAAWKGLVSVRSTPGAGTTFEIVLPMTLAVVESLLVKDSGGFFAFPTSSIARTVGLDARRLAELGGRGVFTDEDGSLPLAPLGELLGIRSAAEVVRRTVVVAERGTQRAGFAVASIEGLFDLIVKPLPPGIARSPEITGAAELPDGDLALALDAGMLLDRVLAAETR
jgi:two-component system, chemotaxis family, sensor kinase CheA